MPIIATFWKRTYGIFKNYRDCSISFKFGKVVGIILDLLNTITNVDTNAFVVSYDTNGEEKWRYEHSTSFTDIVRGIITLASNGMYVYGDTGSAFDIFRSFTVCEITLIDISMYRFCC